MLLAWILILRWNSPWARGTAVAMLAVATSLVGTSRVGSERIMKGRQLFSLLDAAQLPCHDRTMWGRVFNCAWPSYVLILLLQSKVIWRIWERKDITYGDTSGYFQGAKRWVDAFAVDIVWSPLYTAFYGSFMFATSDPYNVTLLHRLVIVYAAAVGVLFVLRQLLSPGLALLGAAWWAILPINYDTLYEVHLFALLPILLVWALILGWNILWARASALAILAACAVLVRNEFMVAAGVLALLCLIHEWHRPRNLAAYAAGIVVAVIVCGFTYWRSVVKFPHIWDAFDAKHTLNMCQVYAFGYHQRHPEWTASPWTECQALARATFGADYPSFGQMLWSNPPAFLEHVWWNLSLVPSGLEVLLFNAMAGTVLPDYIPHNVATYPAVLGALVIALVALGVILAWPVRVSSPVLFAFLPLLVMAVPVMLTQRPRPSYFFYVSVMMIAATMWALGVVLRRLHERYVAVGALIIVVALILFMPSYRIPWYFPAGRPVLAKIENLSPQSELLRKAEGRIILGDRAPEALAYLDLHLTKGYPMERGPQMVFGNEMLRNWKGETALEAFLAEQQIVALYLDPPELKRLRSLPMAQSVLEGTAGWRYVAQEDRGAESWALMARR